MICDLCPNQCELDELAIGKCRARKRENDKIDFLNYGLITSMALDPIEKKPLYHFYPNKKILSVGSFGCNMNCPFCQNHELSMCGMKESIFMKISPKELAAKAKETVVSGNIGLAFTYNEPLICPEFVVDTGREIHRKGLKNVVVTNGNFNTEKMKAVFEVTDAFNIDLKSFQDSGYKKLGGDLESVKEFIRTASDSSHVELTTLIVPGFNDSIKELEEMAGFIAEINEEIPWHLTRFFPQYRFMNKKETEIDFLKKAAQEMNKILNYVYVGNI